MHNFSPSVLLALKTALAAIYWTKKDLRFFVQQSLEHSEIVSQIDWNNQTKFESCSKLIDYMAKNNSIYHEDILSLIRNVTQMTDFEHLRHWDDGDRLVANALSAVSSLKKQSSDCLKTAEEQTNAKQRREQTLERLQKNKDYQAKLAEFYSRFTELSSLAPQMRGYELEKFLNELFRFFDLSPRASFKIKGEQIDGAFTLDSTDYLLEAKWQSAPISNADLFVFAGKISGKLKNTLGLFVSINGFSEDALMSNAHASKSMILMDGLDLVMVLEDRISLPDLIRIKRRHAAETGEIYYRIFS